VKSCVAVVLIMVVSAGIALSGAHAAPVQGEAAVIRECGACSPVSLVGDRWGWSEWSADDDGCWGVCDAGLVFLGVFDADDYGDDEGNPGGPRRALPAAVTAVVFDPVNMYR